MPEPRGVTEATSPVVRVMGVHHRFGSHLVLEAVNLEILQGDFLAVIGPNGSGKSTLLKIILGLLKPERGKVELFGRAIRDFHQWWRMGYVPQKAIHADPIFPITVEEVVGLGLAARKHHPRWITPRDRERIIKALETVQLAGLAKNRLFELSGGQQQRVFIARAIVNDPDILFLDEPTTGVDVKAQDEFYEMLGRLNQKGITIVMITHDIAVLDKHVKKVACLNRTLVFHGTHDEFCSSKEVMTQFLGRGHIIGHRH